MISEIELRPAQLKMLEILEEIDKVCVHHNIKYFLIGGTLIGAMRHKGFIPWDDDCDIGMMREDYEKFLEIAPQELPKYLFVQTSETDKAYYKWMCKVRNINTKLVEFDESENEKYCQGIFVDIFVHDYYPQWSIPLNNIIAMGPRLRFYRKKYPKGSLKRCIVGLGTGVVNAFTTLVRTLYLLVGKTFRRNNKLPLIGIEIVQADPAMFPKNVVFPIKRTNDFEGKYFNLPNDSDAFLRLYYGDYMQIPPVDKRYSHAKKIELDVDNRK